MEGLDNCLQFEKLVWRAWTIVSSLRSWFGGLDFGSERSDSGSERRGLRSERLNLGSERPDFGSEGSNLGSERPDLGS